jgi:hypothetical protein
LLRSFLILRRHDSPRLLIPEIAGRLPVARVLRKGDLTPYSK